MNFCAYDVLRRQLMRAGKKSQQDSSVRERFLAGAMSGVLSDACACTWLAAAQGPALKSHYAGMLATFLCFPLDTLRTRVLAAGAGARLQPTLMKIVREEGVSGLYKYASSPLPPRLHPQQPAINVAWRAGRTAMPLQLS